MKHFFLTLLSLPFAAASYFQLEDAPKCTNGVSFSNIQANCGYGYYDHSEVQNCRLGDAISVTGIFTTESAIPLPACIATTSCFMGFFPCRTYEPDHAFNFCIKLNAISLTGGECPEAGQYSFHTLVPIPNFAGFSLGSGWWIDSETQITDCSGYGYTYSTCQTTLKAVWSSTASDSSMGAMLVGFSIIGLAAIGLLVRRRRRSRAKIDLAQEEERTGDFEMMPDQAAERGVTV